MAKGVIAMEDKASNSDYPALQEVLTTVEVCKLLSVSNHKVYALAKDGELPGRRVAGRPFRFHRDALLKLLGVNGLEGYSEHPDVLNMQQLASFLRLSPKTLYKLHAAGRLLSDDTVIVKSPVRFSRKNVLHWLGGKCQVLRKPR